MVEGTKRRKSKGGARVNAGIFQFAETVENDTWKDKAQADLLKVWRNNPFYLNTLNQRV